MSNLANAVAEAKYDILLIADSDIRVGANYLQRVIGLLHDLSVGVVTYLYRSPALGWVATGEAIGTTTDIPDECFSQQSIVGDKVCLWFDHCNSQTGFGGNGGDLGRRLINLLTISNSAIFQPPQATRLWFPTM